MSEILSMMVPELILMGAACVLFLLGCIDQPGVRRITPGIALVALLAAIIFQFGYAADVLEPRFDLAVRADDLAAFVRLLALAVGVMLLLLAWPSNAEQTGNSALNFGHDAGEFFALFLLSISGLLLVSIANDLILLFLALELVSIPTYIMVSISRREAVAQEAGVKYFFLGALSAALMLFGFSYLYGATGSINLIEIARKLRDTIEATGTLSLWQKLGVLLVILGFAFKMAAFPFHFYAGDVYEGAATPVTAFLAFVPKTAGFVALIKILYVVGGPLFELPDQVATLLAVMAAITMSVGNVLGLLQNNVKRVLAYSSIAHSGYMLVGVAALRAAPIQALEGVLFYLAAYGVMNAGAFGVLMLLRLPDGRAAETFEDLAGQGRRHVGLGLAMAVSCFSLIGIPLTVGFMGKLLLIWPALEGRLIGLALILVINAAVSAAYYLRIVATMFLRPEQMHISRDSEIQIAAERIAPRQIAVILAVLLSVVATLAFGTIPRMSELLAGAATATRMQSLPPAQTIQEARHIAAR